MGLLVLQLFGGFHLSPRDGDPVSLTERAQALLACLAVVRSPLPRKHLAQLLSEAGDEQEQLTTLRQALYLVRKAASQEVIKANMKGELLLNTEGVEADVELFRRAIARGDRCSLERAVEFYRGTFLDGVKSPSSAFEEWLQGRRAEFLELVLDALLKLAHLDAASGLSGSALAYARRALTLDPLREDAHRQVMGCLAALGQRASALRQYEIVRRLLAKELGVAPEAKTTALHEEIGRGDEPGKEVAAQITGDRNVAEGSLGGIHWPAVGSLTGLRTTMIALSVTLPFIAGAFGVWHARQQPQASSDLPSITVRAFNYANGQPAHGVGMTDEITTMLSTHPGIQVVSDSPEPANEQQRHHALSARYALQGNVQESADKMQVMVQLIDVATGDHLWADRLHEEGSDTAALQEQIAYRIYESLVGFTGEIARNEQRRAWRKSVNSLLESDYYLRGEQFAIKGTKEAHANARQIWQEGLAKFPESARIRIGLAAIYRNGVEDGWSQHPGHDLDTAWQLAHEASLSAHRSRYEQWLSHWMMAKLAQWCKNDFERSVAEAKTAVKLVPYDATIRADLAELMANAGRTEEAIEWLQESIRRDPTGPEFYRGNLAWAYYLAGRYEDSLAELQTINKPRPLLLAAIYVRLGRADEARSVAADYLQRHPMHTFVDVARWPLIAPLKRAWLEDLRQAGLAKD